MSRANLPHCTGSCDQGRRACNCQSGQTELANACAPREEFPAPSDDRTQSDDAFRARVLGYVLLGYLVALLASAYGVFA